MNSVKCLFQPQGIYSCITANFYSLSRLDLFQAIKQNFYQSFGVCGANRCDQGFFLFGQLLGFFYVAEDNSTVKFTSWGRFGQYSLLRFYGCSFLTIAEILKESHFQTAAQRVVKASVDVDRQKSKKKASSKVVTASVVNEILTPYLEFAGKWKKFACEELSAHNL